MAVPRLIGFDMLECLIHRHHLSVNSVTVALLPEQFQEKWEPVFRPELRKYKYLERRFQEMVMRSKRLADSAQGDENTARRSTRAVSAADIIIVAVWPLRPSDRPF